MSSTPSSVVQLPTISTRYRKNMKKKSNNNASFKVTINMEDMDREKQMRFLIRLADAGLLPPCPQEIRKKYINPEKQ